MVNSLNTVDSEVDSTGSTDDPLEAFTDWANEPKVTDLKLDYEDARSDHSTQVSKIDYWLDALKIEGHAKHKKVVGKSAIVPKLIRKQAEWRYASLSEPFLSTDDVFNTAPVTYEDKKAAIQNGLVLNNQFNTKIQKVKFFDEYVRTCVDEGTVIVRVGWDFQEGEVEVPNFVPVPIEDPLAAQDMMNAMLLVQQDPEAAQQQIPEAMVEDVQASIEAGVPTELVQDGLKVEIQTIKNQPSIEVCNYNNVIIDPTCLGDLEKAGFIIYSYETSLAELERKGSYKNLDEINIENNTILGEPDHAGPEDNSFNFSDKPRKKFVAYEYWGFWDINNSGMVEPIKATWVGSTMIELIRNPFPDGKLPFVSVQYLPVRKSIYGEPDGELIEDNQQIIGAVTRGMIDIMARSANGQEGYAKGALDITNKRKRDRGDDYEFNPGTDPRTTFHMSTFPEIPQSAGLMLQLQNNEAESISGVKAFSQAGITGQALGDNATGIRSALDATAKRELGILRRLAQGVMQIGRKITSMNGEFLSEEEVIRITNEEFVVIKRDDLDGDIDISLSISTAEADNDKASELSFMLQTMGPNSDPELAIMIQAEIARLRKMPGLAKKLDDWQPAPPDPIEVQKAELEVELLRAQIANENAKANENNANANLDNAKARTEGSNADKTDLDYIEQESGVNQERELQKAGAQARANMGLEAVKHRFNMREKGADVALEQLKSVATSK